MKGSTSAMRVILRLLIALFVGIAALSVSDMGFVAQAIKPAGTLLKIDTNAFGLFGDAEARDEGATVNLGDCLGGTDTKDWPAAYAAICDDLTNAMKADRPAFRDRRSSADEPPKKIGATAVPPSNPRASSLPRARASKSANISSAKTEDIGASPEPAPDVVSCTIDEHGSIRHGKGETASVGASRQIVRGRSPGVALLVPAACDLKSPVTGRVLFAGEFKGYSGVVILALNGGKRRLVIAGLGAIYVRRDDRIARGALIGASARTLPPALASAYEIEKGSLVYFDMRSRNGATEEVSWLADES